ncbi:MAG: hypothetical protein KC593_12180 [Myxococcales bacterium]|nr:hypothetical protein [Myxococcales bacterium]
MSADQVLEQLLFNQPEDRRRFHRALLDHRRYYVFTSAEPHGHAVLRNDAGVPHALVFTSETAVAAFPVPEGSGVKVMDGLTLFTSLKASGLPWWVFNVGGPAGPIAFPTSMCGLILSAPESARGSGPARGALPAAPEAMGTAPLPFQRGALTQHARGLIDVNGVMRMLMSFEDWLVPVSLMAKGPERVGEGLVVYGSEQRLPPGEVWVFTDREAADRVAQQYATLGPYETGVAARDWVPLLDSETICKVNPGGPRDEYWGITSGAFALAKSWAAGLALEQQLAAAPRASGFADPASCADELRQFTSFMVAMAGNGSPLFTETATGFEGYVCLTPDEWAATAAVFQAGGQQVHCATLGSAQLIKLLSTHERMTEVCFQRHAETGRRMTRVTRASLLDILAV